MLVSSLYCRLDRLDFLESNAWERGGGGVGVGGHFDTALSVGTAQEQKGGPGFIFIPDHLDVPDTSFALMTSEPQIPWRPPRRIPAVPAWEFVLGGKK